MELNPMSARLATLAVVAGVMLVMASSPSRGAEADSASNRPNPRYLEWGESQEWVLRADVTIRAWQQRHYGRARDDQPGLGTGGQTAEFDQWRFKTAAFVFPLTPATASSRAGIHQTISSLRVGDTEVDNEPEILRDFPAGARYGRWDIVAPGESQVVTREVELRLELPVRSYETEFHDDAAAEVSWPKGEWPREAKSTFEPMAYVDHDPGEGPYDMSNVQRLLDHWTGGNDPKKLKPVFLAKFLTGKLVNYFQPSGQGQAYNRNGLLEGVDLQGAPVAARRGRGSQFDMVTVLAALYRQAGLPARMVIGHDSGEEDPESYLDTGSSRDEELRAWVEFALYDERDGSLTWVPVDPYRMRRQSSAVRGNFWEKPMPFFGTHDELDGVAPIALHFFPPTTVRSYGGSGSPAFWGWFVTPSPPERAWQAIRFDLSTPAKGPRDEGE